MKLFLTKNKCYIVGEQHVPRGFILHSTGANNPTLRRYLPNDPDGLIGKNRWNNHWNTYQPGGRSVCTHGFIGLLNDGKTVEFVQTLPWEMVGWHAGKGSKGNANYLGYVGVEICEDDLTDAVYFNKCYQKAVEVCGDFCKAYNLNPKTPGVVLSHREAHTLGIASNHGDPDHWFPKFGKTMDDFRNDVYAYMNPATAWDWFSGLGVNLEKETPITAQTLAEILYKLK